MKKNEICRFVDHTLLKPEATRSDILKLCEEARTQQFYAACVHSLWIPLAVEALKNSSVLPICVVSFPFGAQSTSQKIHETVESCTTGAKEIDVVMSLGLFKSADYKGTEEDLRAVVKAAATSPVKVIIETCYLTRDEIVTASKIVEAAGAAYVKTSTGFGPSGAKAEDIALIRQSVSPHIKIKASGGIRDYTKFLEMQKAGADRIGSSASLQILKEAGFE